MNLRTVIQEGSHGLMLKLILLVAVIIYLSLIPLGVIGPEYRLGTPELALIIILVLWLSGAASRLADFSISASGITARFQEIETQQEIIKSQIHTLQVVVKGLVTEFEYEKLVGLSKPHSFMVRFHNDMYEELKRLDAIRYVQPQPRFGIISIRECDGNGDEFDLKQYVRITDEGLQYLKLRNELIYR